MKKIGAIIFLLAVLALVGCASNEGKPSYNRIGKTTAEGSLETRYTLVSASEEAELIAVIQVEQWLSEDPNQMCTFFQCTVKEVLGGELNADSLVLLQTGYSELTIKGYPLFGVGNELLVFLKKAVQTPYDNAYYIIGENTTIFDLIEVGSKTYAIDRTGTFSEQMPDMVPPVKDNGINTKAVEEIKEKDDFWKTVSSEHYSAYAVYEYQTVKEFVMGVKK